jgi:hypothetical protein
MRTARTVRDAAELRDRRSTAVAVGILVVLLTAAAVPVLALAALRLSDDRSNLDAYDAAPVCAAGARTTDASCRQLTEYRVSGEYGHAGKNSVYYLYVVDSADHVTRIQLSGPTGVWPAAVGEAVTVTSWRGSPVAVSDGRAVSPAVDSPDLRRGDGAYAVLTIAGAVYLYLVLVVIIRRAVGPLLLVPVATVLTAIALHGQIAGGL